MTALFLLTLFNIFGQNKTTFNQTVVAQSPTSKDSVGITIFERLKDEKPDAFIKRIYPNKETVHPIFQVKEWDTTRLMIVAFFAPTTAEQEEGIGAFGFAFVEKENNKYAQIVIDTIYQEGDLPTIETVFFANCDKDKKREMFVLNTYNIKHQGVSGKIYETKVYDDINMAKPPRKFRFLEAQSAQFDGGFEGENEEGKQKAKYKEVKEIRGELKRLGF